MATPNRPRPRRLLLLPGVAAALLGLAAAFIGFRHFRAEVLADSAGDLPFRAEVVHVASDAGRLPLLTLDPAAMRSGTVVSRRLEAAKFQPSAPAVGSAIDPVDLAVTRDNLVEVIAAAGLERARAAVADQPTSFPPGDVRSDRSAKAARDTERLDGADARAAADAVRLRQAVALALYGPGLVGWMTSGNADLETILQYRASLLLLTPLPGYAAPLPTEATVRDRKGESMQAHLVSVAYRIDPRFQNIAALYQTADLPADPHFVRGPSYSASLPVGPVLDGIVVPAAAVLWYEGKAWAYVQESPQGFRRQEVSLAHPLPDGSGWFQDRAFQPDETVVVAGAALLLEEEK